MSCSVLEIEPGRVLLPGGLESERGMIFPTPRHKFSSGGRALRSRNACFIVQRLAARLPLSTVEMKKG